MSGDCGILILDDEPLILMDLEFAAEDRGCRYFTAANASKALQLIEDNAEEIDVAILDVTLGPGKTCQPVANALAERGIPYLLHTGDLDRHDELVRELQAQLVAKPAQSHEVIDAALALATEAEMQTRRTAAG